MEKFKGLCIGGAGDGYVHEARERRFQLPRRKHTPALVTSKTPVLEAIERDTYIWTTLSFGGEPTLGFWRLETLSQRDAVMRVFEAYEGTI